MTDFFSSWEVYRAVIDHDCMEHSLIYPLIGQILHERTEPFTVLDLGCGDAAGTGPAMVGTAAARYVGVDSAAPALEFAARTLDASGLDVDLRVEDMLDMVRTSGEQFDVILNMEVIEHVADPAAYTRSCLSMLKPGGLMFVATINRTGKSFALAIVGAEYVLGWLPKGTHQWEKFITPDELKGWIAANGTDVKDESGVTYHPLAGDWRRSRDMGVNYMLVAQKAECGSQ